MQKKLPLDVDVFSSLERATTHAMFCSGDPMRKHPEARTLGINGTNPPRTGGKSIVLNRKKNRETRRGRSTILRTQAISTCMFTLIVAHINMSGHANSIFNS